MAPKVSYLAKIPSSSPGLITLVLPDTKTLPVLDPLLPTCTPRKALDVVPDPNVAIQYDPVAEERPKTRADIAPEDATRGMISSFRR
jgi:hypothetical protein